MSIQNDGQNNGMEVSVTMKMMTYSRNRMGKTN